MIDQSKAICEQPEWALLYCAVVAGKSATFADGVVQRLAAELADYRTQSVFQALRWYRERLPLEELLRKVRSGNYSRLARTFGEVIDSDFDLASVTSDQLQTLHGIGPKSAKFFILWTREGNQQHAALDVHVLRWLAAQGVANVPQSTPSAGPEYDRLEREFLRFAAVYGATPRELDEAIWRDGSGYRG